MAIVHDFTAAVRSSRRNPAFALAVVATLALGMAPNCAIFAIMDSVYFRPLPYTAQERLALLNVSRASSPDPLPLDHFTFSEWQKRAPGILAVASYRNAAFTLNESDRPERVQGQFVTTDFFTALGMGPVLGRAFRPNDSVPGAPPVVIISHRTWQDYFSGRPDIVGLSLRLDGVPATVVGVMPPAFTSFMEGRSARVWAPFRLSAAAAPQDLPLGNAIARLRDGVGLDRVRRELEASQADLTLAFPAFYTGRRPVVRDFASSLFGGLGPAIKLLSIMVGLLLLIACGNAANLLLGRAVRRAHEVALRMALGAPRARLVREALVESLLLAVGGALLGLALTYAGIGLLWAGTSRIFRAIGVDAIVFDKRIVIFAVLLTLGSTLLFSFLPALHGTRRRVAEALREGYGAAGGGRLRMSRALVVAQVALCAVTMVGTLLVVRSFVHYSRLSADPGFHPQGLVNASLPQGDTEGAQAGRLDRLQEIERRVAAIPGVARVAMTNAVPFLDNGSPAALSRQAPEGASQAAQPVNAELRLVDADFFSAMHMPLLRGRTFAESDSAGAPPVVVVNDRLARACWNEADPVGDRVLLDGSWRTVVGVVGASSEPSPFRGAGRDAFVPYVQAGPTGMKLLVRSAQPLASLAPAIRRQVRAVDRDQAVAGLQTMEAALDEFMTPFRLILVLMTLFGGIAAALAAVGLYGVIAHDVSRRTREIGVRIALGARQPAVVRMVVRQGVRLSAWGLALGLLLGAALAKVLPSAVFGASGLSPYHYAGTAAIWLAIAVAACVLPARRASRVAPLAALRAE